MSLSFAIQKIESTEVGFSYSGFNGFRHRIARSIGLKDVYALTDTDMYETGRYKEIEFSHPMYPLIDHDDNEGELGPDDCGRIGSCLRILIQNWLSEKCGQRNASMPVDKDLEFDISMGERLADLMIRCHENDETLLFL